MPIFEGPLIAPKAGAGGGQEGDIAGATDSRGLGPLVPNLVIADEPLNDLGDDGRLVFAHQLSIEPAVVVFVAVVDRDFEASDGRTAARSGAGGREGCETGLSGRFRQQGLETAVGKFEDRSAERKFAVISRTLPGS